MNEYKKEISKINTFSLKITLIKNKIMQESIDELS